MWPHTYLTIMDPSIPQGWKTLLLFYRWGNGIRESQLCCRQGLWPHIFSSWPTDLDQSVKIAYFCLVSSAQTTNYSKTCQDALVEIVSVLLLWLSCLPLQCLPLTVPFPKYRCSLIAIFKLLHSLVLYSLIISAVEQAKFANALLVSSVWVKQPSLTFTWTWF